MVFEPFGLRAAASIEHAMIMAVQLVGFQHTAPPGNGGAPPTSVSDLSTRAAVCPLPPWPAVWWGIWGGVLTSVLFGVIFVVVFYVAKNNLFAGHNKDWFKGVICWLAAALISYLGFKMFRFIGWEEKWKRKLTAAAAEKVRRTFARIVCVKGLIARTWGRGLLVLAVCVLSSASLVRAYSRHLPNEWPQSVYPHPRSSIRCCGVLLRCVHAATCSWRQPRTRPWCKTRMQLCSSATAPPAPLMTPLATAPHCSSRTAR